MSGDLSDLTPRLRALTPARVRLAAGGGAAPLASVLDFQASHARARDAIRQPVDWDAVKAGLGDLPYAELESRAVDRDVYIRRPDLGRRLSEASLTKLEASGPDLCIVIADGLSAFAVDTHGATMARRVVEALPDLTVGPVALVRGGRVAVGDEVAQAMGAAMSLVLIGERPGLSVSDSLGAYLTWGAKVGTPDSARNCVSNIHGRGGLDHDRAVDLIAFLIRRAREIRASGTMLKDDRAPVLPKG